MTDQWRYQCPHCGSRQIAMRSDTRGRHSDSRPTCRYRRCDATRVDPIDLKAD